MWLTAHYGTFGSGFTCGFTCDGALTWTIGTSGQFSSVHDALGGGNPGWDFYVLDSNFHEWAGTVSPVPLPASGLLIVAALGGLGTASFRRRTRSA